MLQYKLLKNVILSFGLVLLCASMSLAATYYVSPSGSATWPSCIDANDPCSARDGLYNVSAGDTLLFRGGTYSVSGSSFSTVHSGILGHPITLAVYPGETAVLHGDSSREVLIEAYNVNYITIDGFTLRTDMNIAGPQAVMVGTGNIVKNCTFEGNTSTTSTNSPAIYIPDDCIDCTIQNNYISDYQSTNGSDNICAIMVYSTEDLVIENNTIKNCYNGIYIKQNNDGVHVRNNFISDITDMSAIMIQAESGNYEHNTEIYNNVIIDTARFVLEGVLHGGSMNNIYVYNNTMYNARYGLNQPDDSTTGVQFWNNIYSNITDNAIKNDNLTYSDYQMFYNTPQLCVWRCASPYLLSEWQDLTAFDDNSNENNPNFVNAGGTNPEDYKRTSYPQDGRGGSYASVMGAYIAGNEVIGYTGDGVESPPLRLSAPAEYKIELL